MMRNVQQSGLRENSIDEVFIDVTNYLHTYGMTAHEMTMTMVRDAERQSKRQEAGPQTDYQG